MSPPLPLSISILTLNEEANLGRCLSSVRGLAREVVVVDSGSTDHTAEIARAAGATFHHHPWPGWVAQYQHALQRCSQPWTLNLDADEALSPELQRSIRSAFERGEPAVDGFWVNRRTFYLGDWIRHSWYPEWRLRLVRTARAHWSGLDPHTHLNVPGDTARLGGDLLHYSFRDLEDHLRRTVRYARTNALARAARGDRFRWAALGAGPPAAFLKSLVLKQGWRDGWRGVLIAGSRALDAFAKQAFLMERERAPTVPGALASSASSPDRSNNPPPR
jgi:glycosyltransferase involved in cell wall biosynthesis